MVDFVNLIWLFPLLLLCVLLVSVMLVNREKQIWKEERLRLLRQIGEEGEEETIRQLERVRGRKYIFHNVYVPLKDGKNTTEIDVVMVHEKGVIVIENKNYSGWIYGKEEEGQWLQVQKQNGRKREKTFYNPVWQNRTHIRNLKRVLEQEFGREIPFLSVITFNDKAKLKRIRVLSGEALVSESRKARRRLARRLRRMPKRFSRKEMELMGRRLLSLENPGKRVRKRHGEYLEKLRSREAK